MSRSICIGDIHGCFDEFMSLLDLFNYDEGTDKIYITGDMVDRGPDSDKVVGWVRKASFAHPKLIHCVKGNHEDKHFRYYKHSLKKRRHPNFTIPMRPFSMDKLRVYNSLSDEDMEFIGALPPMIYLEDLNWVVVHAGFEPLKPLWQQDHEKITHIRFLSQETKRTVSVDGNYLPPENSIFWTEFYDLNHNVVYGHNVHSLELPHITNCSNGMQLVGLDTGSCFGGHLSGFILPTSKGERISSDNFIQVLAKRTYSRSILRLRKDLADSSINMLKV